MALPISKPKLPVVVEKPTPYTFDLGHLLAEDPNPVTLNHSSLDQSLAELARDGAQSLINQLLTTCPLKSTSDGVLLTLPQPATRLPREKPVPQPKPPTKWERFAAKKGIKAKTREARRNLAYDEESGEWKRKWGYKGLNKKGEDDWLVEVDAKKEAERKEGTSIRGDGRRERKEKIQRNERKMRKNQRDAAGKMGKKV
ncbi:ribosomal biogenesis regulatory protein [Trichoderma sp. SZMC 28015]|uniref:Ribosome biogenesis regulatory protein n=1 Tax=Trichoderma breve TaxID=2034170 RepID=A0A9W9BD49_9HYPO|nr:ribosome biogenesis regulatory protein (RRS1) domain-containing protein [Trichoderma breve]KAJ4861057.1 ribosome biogenesis regulatory protein (RRS1) domain-containing protein [Trichoderma breve]